MQRLRGKLISRTKNKSVKSKNILIKIIEKFSKWIKAGSPSSTAFIFFIIIIPIISVIIILKVVNYEVPLDKPVEYYEERGYFAPLTKKIWISLRKGNLTDSLTIAEIYRGISVLAKNSKDEELKELGYYLNRSQPQIKRKIVFEALNSANISYQNVNWFPFKDFSTMSADSFPEYEKQYFNNYTTDDWDSVFTIISGKIKDNIALWSYAKQLCTNMLILGADKAAIQDNYTSLNNQYRLPFYKQELTDIENDLERKTIQLEEVQKKINEYEEETFTISGYIRSVGLYKELVYECRTFYDKDFLLKMTESEFTGRGRFSLFVKREGTVEVRTAGGFTPRWPLYVEVTSWEKRRHDLNKEEVKGLPLEIKSLKGKLQNQKNKLTNAEKDLKTIPDWLK